MQYFVFKRRSVEFKPTISLRFTDASVRAPNPAGIQSRKGSGDIEDTASNAVFPEALALCTIRISRPGDLNTGNLPFREAAQTAPPALASIATIG
jgi:hypothetical protein